MHWLTFAVLAATSYGFYNFFIKMSAGRLSPTIALMFLAGTSFLVAMISTLTLRITGQPLTFSRGAILFPILAGVFAGIGEVLYIFMFSKNAPLTIANPLAVGGTIIVAVLLGFIILREPLGAMKISGIVITLIGLFILTRG